MELWCTPGLGEENKLVKPKGPNCENLDPTMDASLPDLRHAAWVKALDQMTPLGPGAFQDPVPGSMLDYPACVVRVVADGDHVVTSKPLLSRPLCEVSMLPEVDGGP